jgi:replicative DNA helicase
MRTTKKQLEKYYDKRASCQVLGCLMKNPSLLKDKKFALSVDDFSKGNHELLYKCLYNLTLQGLKEIKVGDIETYLSANDPKSYSMIFENEKNLEWLYGVYEDANDLNYECYYTKIRKLSLLRSYLEEGIDVSEILNVDEVDHVIIKRQQDNLDAMTLIEIQQYFDKKNFSVKEKFIIKDSSKRRKAGDNAEELREKMKQSPVYGYGLESQYLNTLSRGALKGGFFLETRDSGKGKTREAIQRLLLICCPYLWNHEKNDFVINPNGENNVGLYIGTEMQLYEELEPMIWAFISGVEEYKIKENRLTEEENLRIDKAIEYAKQTKLFLEDEANYDLAYLWNTIDRYKTKEGLDAVAIDYLELTVGLTSEYVQLTRGMTAREDQVLLNLSQNIKNMAKEYNVVIFGYTQTTDEARRDGVRDQRAVKGARSLPNKVDIGITVFSPTKKELELIQPLIQRNKGLNKTITPNTCYTIYKNRFGKITEEVKIWCYQNLGNMKTIDLFCTNRDYEPISIDKTIIDLTE